MMLHRCYYCDRWIMPWPWEHVGWVNIAGVVLRWHARCRKANDVRS